MAEVIGDAVLELRTDDRRLRSGLASAQQRSLAFVKRSSAAFKGMGRAMSLGFTLPLAFAAKASLDELQAITAANRNTESAIRNVGKGSLVTANDIRTQAQALQQLSGFDDQAIQSAQNLLLRFGNLNVKTKEGAAAFRQASSTVVDMAAAMGKDPVTAANLLKKALADPEKGIQLLGRQMKLSAPELKKLKKNMAAAGTTAKKQSLLMGALSTRIHGAAEAAGGTPAAKWAVMIDQLKGVGAVMMESLMPILVPLMTNISKLANKFNELSPRTKKVLGILLLMGVVMGPVITIIGFLGEVIAGVVAAIGAVGLPVAAAIAVIGLLGAAWLKMPGNMAKARAALVQVRAFMQKTFTYLKDVVWPMLQVGAQKAIAWLQSNVIPTVSGVLTDLIATITVWVGIARALWERYGADIIAVFSKYYKLLFTIVGTALKLIGNNVRIILAIFRGDWRKAWTLIRAGVMIALRGIGNILKAAVGFLGAAARALGHHVTRGILGAMRGLAGLAVSLIRKAIKTALHPADAIEKAKSMGKRIIEGILHGISSISGKIKDALIDIAKDALKSAMDILKIGSPSILFAERVGAPIGQGIALGIRSSTSDVMRAVNRAVSVTATPARVSSAQTGAQRTAASGRTAPVVHVEKVEMNDTNVDLPLFLRRADWYARTVGAY